MALKSIDNAVKDASENDGQREKDGLADGDANLMIKLKFLTYKVIFSQEGVLAKWICNLLQFPTSFVALLS